jgi:hypothetical protein
MTRIDHTGHAHPNDIGARTACRDSIRQGGSPVLRVTTCPWCPDADAPDARYHPNGHPSHRPPIITADGKVVHTGDRVFDYYDGYWGTIGRMSSDGVWFDHNREDGSGRGFLDGSRVCVRIPPGNPFYRSHGAGNPA